MLLISPVNLILVMLRHKQGAKLYFVSIFNTIFIGNILSNLVAIFHVRICEAWEKAQKNAQNSLHSITVGSSALCRCAIFKQVEDGLRLENGHLLYIPLISVEDVA